MWDFPAQRAARFNVGWGSWKLEVERSESRSSEEGLSVREHGFSEVTQRCSISRGLRPARVSALLQTPLKSAQQKTLILL